MNPTERLPEAVPGVCEIQIVAGPDADPTAPPGLLIEVRYQSVPVLSHRALYLVRR